MDRFEILKEPTDTYTIYDTVTKWPATIEDRAFIGLSRHEVPLALLAVIEAVQPVNGPVLPSLSVLNGGWEDETIGRFQNDRHA